MRLPRLLLAAIALCLVLGLGIWLVGALSQLYWQLSWAAPWLANLVVGLVIVLLAALVGALAYYSRLFARRPVSNPTPPPKVSEIKTEAAAETLAAVERQVRRIQDQVARQALLERSRELQENLARGELLVAVFGTGSAGKTSLVNALMGRVVGEVGAPMGTTETGQTYALRLRGLEREILLTDTPGILEAGTAGTARDRLARRLAAQADLLIFVVEDDLRQSELEPLRELAALGKRSLLVLNKVDRLPEDDRAALLAQLAERLTGLIAEVDLVPVAANPAPVTLPDGQIFQADPDIMPLVRRMAAVLRAEGEDLIADNMLLQAQRLGKRARQLLDAQRRRQAEKTIERYQWLSAGAVAVTPLPFLDLLAAAAVNAQMVVELGKIYGCDLAGDRAQELALSIAKTLTSLGIVKGATSLLAAALQLSLAGAVVGKAIQAVTAAYLTRIAGRSFVEYFRRDQDWGDGGITEVVRQQFDLEQRDRVVQRFVKTAIAKVVEPFREPSP